MQQIVRFNDSTANSITLTTSTSTTGGWGMNTYSGGVLLVESVSAPLTLSFHCRIRPDSATTFQLHDSSGVAVTLAVAANRAYPLPDALFGASYVLATTSAGTASCKILLKG